jgi:uncharacterized protein
VCRVVKGVGLNGSSDGIAFLAGLVIALVTSPVGVSGAVFLLPVQLTVLQVPNPQLTPTNLLYNVVSGPGALVRYARQGQIDLALVRTISLGSVPGVVIGAVLRVTVASDPTVFRLVAAAVLLPTGLLVLRRSPIRALRPRPGPAGGSGGPSSRTVSLLAFGTGVVGGMYGIGGGSLLAPLLAGWGAGMAVVAPAALASTFLTSIVGVVTFWLLALGQPGTIAPDLSLGVAAGLGGIVGGYLGARLQPHVPERRLRDLLGAMAVLLAISYVVQAALSF